MHIKNSFFKNKKGNVEISLTEVMGAALFVIILVSIVFISAKLINIFSTNKDYDSTMESFGLLGDKINELVEDKDYSNANMLYFLDSQYILVGYSYKDSEEMKSCNQESLKKSRKNLGKQCEKSCICIYENTLGKDFDEDLQFPLECISFSSNVVFLAPAYQEQFCGEKTGWYPAAYSDYYQEEYYQFLILEGFNTEEIYLDKYQSEKDDIFIFMGIYKESPEDKIYQRKQFMEARY